MALASSARDALRYRIGTLWRRSRTSLLVVCVALAGIAAVWSGVTLALDAHRNGSIAALRDGHDVAVSNGAPTKLLAARAYFLMTHDRLDEARTLVSLLDLKADDGLRSMLHYDLANAALKEGFAKIEAGDLNGAGAFVGVSREDYIEALRLDPMNWDARFNFDVASRLVRQYPTFGFTPDPRRKGPKPMWTELPSIPQGEP